MVDTSGAPRDQGIDQAAALRGPVRDSVASLRSARGWLAWRRELRAARRGTGRALARFVPQLHERLQGIAAGARVPLAALELGESLWRIRVAGGAKGPCICGGLELPAGLELLLRQSRPDAGGFPSLELAAAPLASAVCGVNAEGLAVAVTGDGPPGAPPVRALAADLLLRTRSFGAALEHLRRRAPYLGSTGELLIASASGECARAELRSGRVSTREPALATWPGAAPRVTLDAAAQELVWHGSDGSEQRASVEGAGEPAGS